MARGINKVIIVGNLGADPEVRYTGRRHGDRQSTHRHHPSNGPTNRAAKSRSAPKWHRVKLFGRLAEISGEYLKKGRQVYIEGSLRTDKYTDKEGVERYSTDIIANEMQNARRRW